MCFVLSPFHWKTAPHKIDFLVWEAFFFFFPFWEEQHFLKLHCDFFCIWKFSSERFSHYMLSGFQVDFYLIIVLMLPKLENLLNVELFWWFISLNSPVLCSSMFLVSAFVFSRLMQCFTSQEDSEKAGRVTSAGMYFLHFQVYRMDSTVNAVCKLSLSSSSSSSYWAGLGCE